MAIVSDVEIRLRADIARLQQDLNGARRSVDSAMVGIRQSVTLATNALGGLAAGMGLSQIVQAVDKYAKFTAQLRIATDGAQQFATAYADVKRIANSAQADLAATGTLYARIAAGTKELGISQERVGAIVESTTLALRVSGATTEESASAILQLSQAFGAGALRGEEFNAVNEAAPRLMKAIADGLGVPVGALKAMATEGKITAEVMAGVLPRALDTLREEARQVQTISGAFQVLKNKVLEFTGATAQSSGSVSVITSAIGALADNLQLAAGAVMTLTAAKLGTWLITNIERANAAVIANRTLATSTLASAQANATATAQASLLANARLAEVRAATLAATGEVQLALATNGVIPAQVRATAAATAHTAAMLELSVAQRAASVGATAASGVIAALGGPVGALITVLGIAATAWSWYQSRQEEANRKASEQTEDSTNQIIENLDKQTTKLRERLELSRQVGAMDIAQGGGPAAERLASFLAKINDLKARGNALSDVEKLDLITQQGLYNDLFKTIKANTQVRAELDATGTSATALVAVRERLNGVNGQYMKDLQALQTAREKGAVGEAEYIALVQKLATETYKASDAGQAATVTAKAAAAEANRNKEAYESLLLSVRRKVTESVAEAGGTRELNDAEKMAIDITEQLRLGKLKLSEAQQGVVKGLVEEYRANLASVESHKAYKKMQEQAGTLEKEMTGKRKEAIDAAKAEVKTNEELVATFGMTEAAIARLELARLKEQLAQRSSVGMTLDEIENLEQLIALKEKSAAALANVEALKETQQFWTDIEKTAHDTFLSIADGGKNMWQRLKESAKNMFFDWLYQMTVRKWIINVGASFSGTAGVSGIAGAADALGGGGGSSMGGMASYVSAGQAIYKGFATGFASVGTGIGTYVSALGNTMGSSAVSAFGSGMGLTSAQAAEAAAAYNAAGMSSTGSAISAGSAAGSAVGTVAGVAAGAAIGHYGGRAISNGYSVTGGSGNSMVNTGTAVGAGAGMIIGGPLGAAVGAALGGLIGGLVNRAFGHKAREYEDPQLVGSLAATGVSGKTSAKWLEKGGWFSSDRRGVDTKEIDQEMADLLSGGYNAIQTATLNLAGVFGVSADVLAGYSKSLNFKISKDAAENEKMLLELFTSIGDDMAARVVPDIAKFKREGETAAQTLERLAGEFQVVDGVLTTLGATSQEAFGSIGVASIEARSRLLALSGGVEAMAAQTQYFADNFLTAAQQIAPAQQLVARELSAMGYAQVNSVEQYRAAVLALVESGALATDEGARTYAKLMSLAPAFKTVTDAAVEAGRAQADAWLEITERSVNAQKDVVTKAYDDAMAALELRIEGVNATIERTGELSRALRSALGTVESSAQQEGMRAAAQAQITAALAIAKAGGALPTADDLRDALAALGRDASGQFDSLAAYQREVARTNNELIALGGISDGQLDTAERQLRAMQEYGAAAKLASEMELARLDTLYATAQAQVGALSAANTTLTDISNTLIAIQANNVGIVPETGVSLASELERQQMMSGGAPVPSYTAPSAATNSDAAMLAALQSMEARMANVENNTMRAATATAQFASQFDLVSAGGNAIATEVVS